MTFTLDNLINCKKIAACTIQQAWYTFVTDSPTKTKYNAFLHSYNGNKHSDSHVNIYRSDIPYLKLDNSTDSTPSHGKNYSESGSEQQMGQ